MKAPLALLLLCSLWTSAQDIKVNVRLVHLLATVKDASGRLIGDLTPADFAVLDNNVPQKISVFERRTEQPLSVAILIDNSGSTAKDLKFETDSVSRFAKALFDGGNDLDRAALYSFNWEVVQHVDFTRQPARIDRAVRALHGEAGTSLYDAIYLASAGIESRPGRHVIVVVTDGGDTTSSKDYRAALEAAHSADAVIYPVLVIPVEASAGRNTGGEHSLATMAASTGGRVFEPTLGAALDQAFTDILNELRTQYFIAYYPHDVPPTRNRFHNLELRVARAGLRIVTRNGYYGESSP